MYTFRQEFDKVLGDRTQPEQTILEIISKYKSDNFNFELSPFIDYDMSGETEENWETYTAKEFPGYQLMIIENKEPKKEAYSRQLIKLIFPKDDRTFPINLELATLNKNKKDSVASIEDLERCIEAYFNSSDYLKLIQRIEQALKMNN